MKFVEANISSGIINSPPYCPTNCSFVSASSAARSPVCLFTSCIKFCSLLLFFPRNVYLQGREAGCLAPSTTQVTGAGRTASANHDPESPHRRRRPHRLQKATERHAGRRRGGGGKFPPTAVDINARPRRDGALVNGHCFSSLSLHLFLFSIFRV
jgi:hypothetical protein